MARRQDARVHCVDVFEHLLRLAVLHQLHRGPPVETRQGLRPVPGIGNQGRAEAWFDLVQDLDQFP
jgi:hypothetical protein